MFRTMTLGTAYIYLVSRFIFFIMFVLRKLVDFIITVHSDTKN
jgi:hypothetical protein